MLSREQLERFTWRPDVASPMAVQEMARELLATRWRPITETDLPTMRDEVGRWLSDGRFETGSVGATADFSVWRDRRWTHFRPINPPARTDKGEA